MKRRNFLAAGAAGALGFGLTANGAFAKSYDLKKGYAPFDFERTTPKPSGTMPMAEIGKTGIKVSKFGFGSHIQRDILKNKETNNYDTIREKMVRDAYDMGINLFDVYDLEQHCFQYEPMGRYLKPIKNDVIISILLYPNPPLTLEQELERDLKLFKRDYIDLVRIEHVYSDKNKNWGQWEQMFKFKEQGKIRAVGIPIHLRKDLEQPLKDYPLDYVILPFNYFHNWTWAPEYQDKKVESIIPSIRKKGAGVITMKPFASEWLVGPLNEMGKQINPDINVAKAALRYIINSGLEIDTTLGGMYYPYQINENIDAYFNPKMSNDEKKVIKELRNNARIVADNYLPEHYKFLNKWVPDSWDDSDLFGKI